MQFKTDLKKLAGDKGSASLADIFPDNDLKGFPFHDLPNLAQFLTEEFAVGGEVLTAHIHDGSDGVGFTLAVRVLIDHDFGRINDSSVINILQAGAASPGVLVQAALVKLAAALPLDFHIEFLSVSLMS